MSLRLRARCRTRVGRASTRRSCCSAAERRGASRSASCGGAGPSADDEWLRMEAREKVAEFRRRHAEPAVGKVPVGVPSSAFGLRGTTGVPRELSEQYKAYGSSLIFYHSNLVMRSIHGRVDGEDGRFHYLTRSQVHGPRHRCHFCVFFDQPKARTIHRFGTDRWCGLS